MEQPWKLARLITWRSRVRLALPPLGPRDPDTHVSRWSRRAADAQEALRYDPHTCPVLAQPVNVALAPCVYAGRGCAGGVIDTVTSRGAVRRSTLRRQPVSRRAPGATAALVRMDGWVPAQLLRMRSELDESCDPTPASDAE